mmetsp:Transcript_30013/g.77757  ORF Transcript_30013/g.77757 Transcript_30013/m.77757 type:complete len:285 (+) Transcript_30013:92-946(+)
MAGGQWWCVHNDPCGMCCVVVTYSLLCFADYVVVHAVLTPWLGQTANCYMIQCSFVGISILAMASHARTMTTDPGAVPIEYQPSSLLEDEQGRNPPMCSKCNGYKPPRAHHCSQCDRCVMKMDHHCPWVNNCVGANNQKHFVLFCFYTCLLSVYALGLLLCRALFSTDSTLGQPRGYHRGHGHGHGGGAEAGGRFLLMALLFFEAILFGLFTCAMTSEQLSSILSDQTGIEKIKQDYTPQHQRSTLHLLSETFGRPFSLLWFLPTAVRFNGLTFRDMMPMDCEV